MRRGPAPVMHVSTINCRFSDVARRGGDEGVHACLPAGCGRPTLELWGGDISAARTLTWAEMNAALACRHAHRPSRKELLSLSLSVSFFRFATMRRPAHDAHKRRARDDDTYHDRRTDPRMRICRNVYNKSFLADRAREWRVVTWRCQGALAVRAADGGGPPTTRRVTRGEGRHRH